MEKPSSPVISEAFQKALETLAKSISIPKLPRLQIELGERFDEIANSLSQATDPIKHLAQRLEDLTPKVPNALRELDRALKGPSLSNLNLKLPDFSELVANTAAIQAISTTLQDFERAKSASVGKKSPISEAVKLAPKSEFKENKEVLQAINITRKALEATAREKRDEIQQRVLEDELSKQQADVTLPVAPVARGTVHPVSQVMDELAEIFADLGFAVATGPEIEDDWHNFSALNFPEDHPARAMHDTFYLAQSGGDGGPRLLRTHTSPVQIRTMASQKPPIYIIAPGRVYRSDSDATHTPMFHQIEGLVIDRGITLAHLKWTLETFLSAFFERDDIVLRLRPSYFPFTEPSAEVDVGYRIEKGRRVLGGGDHWMELLGSGMVHPNVIRNCGLDPDEWQGFAFGVGIDRLAMLKYGMDDLRAFFDGDLRWLRHYGFAALDVPTLSGGVGA